MINHTQAEAMGILTNVLCQVGVTTLIAKFLILDILIDRDSPIFLGRGFLRTIGGIVNTPERLFSTFDGFCHQTFCAARSDVIRNAESDSDDEEEYQIKRNKFGSPIYGPKPASYLNCNNPYEQSLAIQTNPDYKGSYTKEEEATGQWRTEIRTMGTHDDEAGSSRSKRSRQHETVEEVLLPQVHYEFLLFGKDYTEMGYDGEIDYMLRIRLREAESNEEIFTSMAWIRAFNINEPIYAELAKEYIISTYEFDEVCADDELQTKKIIKFRLGGRTHSLTLLKFARRLGLYHADELEEDGFNVYFEGDTKMGMRMVLTEDVVRSLSALIYYRDLDTTPLRYLIAYEGRLIPEDPQPGVSKVSIPRPPRSSMQELYDRMGRMEIRQEAIERMEYRQSYH
ncbi:hypothetical protein Tco_0290963 [Tanacetum coccineum]